MTRTARLHFHSQDVAAHEGVATITESGTFRLTVSPALSIALREAERMAREAVEMGKGVGGSPLEGLAVWGIGWTDELVMAAAAGLPLDDVTLRRERNRLVLHVRCAHDRASLTLELGDFDEHEAAGFIATIENSGGTQHAG